MTAWRSRASALVACLLAVPALADCEPVVGIGPLLRPGNVLLLGELHGTVEMPAFAADVACHAAGAGLDVVVGLELLPSATEAVEVFLASPDRDRLLAGTQWTRSYQDGRTSRAMVDLLQRLARLREQGRSLRVVLFDAQPAGGGQARERAMAANLAASAEAHPQAVHIVLTGDAHSRMTQGGRSGVDYEPMGHLLGRAIGARRVTALKAAHAGGGAWICAPDCGAMRVRGRGSAGPGTIEIDEATRPAGHHGWFGVGSLTASPPAVGEHEVALVERDSSPIPPPPEPEASFPEQTAELLAPFQGSWEAWQYGTKAWTIEIDERRFHGVVGADDWYVGRIRLRPERQPAEIDFLIEDCRCDYRGMVSRAIFRLDAESILLAAPQPGLSRPTGFNPNDGRTVELRRAGR